MSTTVTRTQPDISYHPHYTKFQLRTEQLKPERPATPLLPSSFPEKLTGPLEGIDFKDNSDWIFVLNEEQPGEIGDTLVHFKCKSIKISKF
jgi:hypothetical protein